MIHGHFIKRCKECNDVMAQCRCMQRGKSLELSLCFECRQMMILAIMDNEDNTSVWEYSFIEDIEKYTEETRLTPSQEDKLIEIYNKVGE